MWGYKLVVEVLSPFTKGKDMAAKLNLYMRSGVREYWIVHNCLFRVKEL